MHSLSSPFLYLHIWQPLISPYSPSKWSSIVVGSVDHSLCSCTSTCFHLFRYYLCIGLYKDCSRASIALIGISGRPLIRTRLCYCLILLFHHPCLLYQCCKGMWFIKSHLNSYFFIQSIQEDTHQSFLISSSQGCSISFEFLNKIYYWLCFRLKNFELVLRHQCLEILTTDSLNCFPEGCRW